MSIKNRTLWALLQKQGSPDENIFKDLVPVRSSSTNSRSSQTSITKTKMLRRPRLSLATETRNKSMTLNPIPTASEGLRQNELAKVQFEDQVSQSNQHSFARRKTLKKLYTDAMYKRLSGKLEDLKKHYEHIYTNVIKNSDVDIEREKIKDIVLKSEGLFTSTYSVKYFGVKNDQVGILSKRLWLKQKYKPTSDQVSNSLNYSKLTKTTENSSSQIHALENSKKKSIGAMNEIEERIYEERSEIFENNEKRFESVRQDRVPENNVKRVSLAIVENIGGTVNRKTLGQELKLNKGGDLGEDLEDNISMHNNYNDKSIKGSGYITPEPQKILPSLKKELQRNSSLSQLSSTGSENHLITRYFVPKRLQAPKKVAERKSILRGLPEGSKEQIEINASSFERILKTLPKVRRNMLRNVTTQFQREDDDESEIIEKVKPYETKQDNGKIKRFSYSTLLKTIHSADITTDSVKEKSRILERILKNKKNVEGNVQTH